MLPTFPDPILSVTAEAVRDPQGQDALRGLWIVLTKCNESVQDGPQARLENISWRLWYHELIPAQVSCKSSTSELAIPHPKDERSRSSYFPVHTNQKVSLELQVVSSGLPSHSDQASPSPLPPQVPTTVPPPTPEHPRISLHGHSSGTTAPLSSSTRGKSSTGDGHLIVDLLSNQNFIPQRKSTSAATTTTAVLPTPPPAVQPSRSSDLGVLLFQLPTPTQAPFPRVVIVNPTPHPNPPVAPILHGDAPGAPQLPPEFLLPPLPPPTLRPTVSTAEVHAQHSREPPSSHTLARQSDCRIFLQQSPANPSPERGGVSTASGKSPSDLFEASSAASSQVKSALTDADVDDDNKEDKEGEEDRQPTITAVGAGARHPACGRQKKLKRKEESGMRPLVKRSHLAKHLALSTIRKLSAQQQHPRLERAETKVGVLNIGSGYSNASRPANGSAGNANGNGNGNTQSRKTIVVASTSLEEFETIDGEDSEEWASEGMDPEDEARKAEETRLHEVALEAQRQRELFAKVPRRSYSNLNRPQSGLLSQLMNPNPAIFPPNHPHRISRSSANISRQHQQPEQHGPVLRRGSSAYAPPQLSMSMAALPLAAQITTASSSRPPTPSVIKQQEMEDSSGDDADDKIQMSQSVAQQKLQALISCQSSEQGRSSHFIQPVAMEVGPGLLSSANIPLDHPYNLPAAAPPMTPRTTRRRMLETELSESMRRQLLWERQVSSNTNLALAARRASQGIGGLRPLTSTSSEGIEDTSTRSTKDERRRRAMARYRSWADDYHYSGW